MSKPSPIQSILQSTLKGLEVDFQVKLYSIFGAWKEIVGESLALQTRPRSIRNRILFVDVSHPTWMQQLQFFKPKLLQKLNDFLGETMLLDVRFFVGKIAPGPAARPETDPWQQERLDDRTHSRIESLLLEIKDEEIRKTVRSVLTKGAKLEQHRKKVK